MHFLGQSRCASNWERHVVMRRGVDGLPRREDKGLRVELLVPFCSFLSHPFRRSNIDKSGNVLFPQR